MDAEGASVGEDQSHGDSELSLLVRTLFQKGALNVNEADVDEDTTAQVKCLLSNVRVKNQSPLVERIESPTQTPVPHHNHGPGPRRLGITKRSHRPVASRPVTKPVTADRNAQRPKQDKAEADLFNLTFSDTLTQAPKKPAAK